MANFWETGFGWWAQEGVHADEEETRYVLLTPRQNHPEDCLRVWITAKSVKIEEDGEISPLDRQTLVMASLLAQHIKALMRQGSWQGLGRFFAKARGGLS